MTYCWMFDHQAPTQQQKDMVEQAATVTAQDNMELACAYIQKTAMEKATPEIDKILMPVSSHQRCKPSCEKC